MGKKTYNVIINSNNIPPNIELNLYLGKAHTIRRFRRRNLYTFKHGLVYYLKKGTKTFVPCSMIFEETPSFNQWTITLKK